MKTRPLTLPRRDAPARGPRSLLAACSILGLLAPAGAVRAAEVPQLAVEQYRLKNGLTVILHQDPRLPVVAVNVWYDVGGLHEKPGKSGFAHLFEHMMFQGSRHVPEDAHFPLLQAAGATDVNGSTDFDRTNYFETVPKNQLALALWLEADRMGFLLDHINESSFKNQLEVVKNERRQSVEQAPYQLLEEKMVQTMYPAPHPYHGNVIGSMDDLSSASLNDVREFWLTYYTPENASLAVVGDIDPATVKAEIERYFGSLVGRKKPPAPVVTPPVLHGQTIVRHEETVGRLPKVIVQWMAPPPYAPGSSELELLAEILSGTRASRLDAKLVYADQIAQTASVHLRSLKGGSVFELSVTLRPGHTAEEGLAAIDQVLADLKKHPPTAAELARAKNSLLTRSVLRLEGGNARAELFQDYVLYLGDANKLAWELEHTAQATLPDVRAAAERTLTGDRLVGLAIPTMTAGGAK